MSGDIPQFLQVVNGFLSTNLVPTIGNQEELAELFQLQNFELLRRKYPKRAEIIEKILNANSEGRSFSDDESSNINMWVGILTGIEEYIKRHHDDELDELKDSQIDVFEDILAFFEEGLTDGYLKLPTGYGKTFLASKIIETTNLKTLILVPSKLLADQTEEAVGEFAPDYLDVRALYGTRRANRGEDVTIMTYSKFLIISENPDDYPEIDLSTYELLILDEAHSALSNRRFEAVKNSTIPFKIGLTATPYYSDKKKVSNLLPEVIHQRNVIDGVKEGRLSEFSVYRVNMDVDLGEVELVEGEDGDIDFSEKILSQRIYDDKRNRDKVNEAALDIYKKFVLGGESWDDEDERPEASIMFCAGINHAINMADELNKIPGIKAAAVYGSLDKSERQRILQEYEEGKIDVLCNADLLIYGFNEPRASICFNLVPTSSQVVAEQRGGRILRINPNDPEKEAIIFDFFYKGLRNGLSYSNVVNAASFHEVEKPESLKVPTRKKRTGDRVRETDQTELTVKNAKVLTDPVLIMSVDKTGPEITAGRPPEDEVWFTRHSLANALGRSYTAVCNALETVVNFYREENEGRYPEWFAMFDVYDAPGLPPVEHLNIYAANLIKDYFEIGEQLYEQGWRSDYEIVAEVNIDGRRPPYSAVRKLISKYSVLLPSENENMEVNTRTLSKFGSPKIAYNPLIVKAVVEEVTRLEREVGEHPRKNRRQLARALGGINDTKINTLLDLLRERKMAELGDENWVDNRISMRRSAIGNKPGQHFDADLEAELINLQESLELEELDYDNLMMYPQLAEHMEGWGIGTISRATAERSAALAIRRAEYHAFKRNEPFRKEDYIIDAEVRGGRGHIVPHVKPITVELIKQLPNMQYPPENWKNLDDLIAAGSTKDIVRKRFERVIRGPLILRLVEEGIIKDPLNDEEVFFALMDVSASEKGYEEFRNPESKKPNLYYSPEIIKEFVPEVYDALFGEA